MQVACRSLIEAEMSISEAAHATGYASESAFTRVFKKEVGTTPAAFRAAH
jgi:AraC family transcriptional regulator, activator of mtrCDE